MGVDLGVDLGIKALVTLSDGTVVENPKPLKRIMRRLNKAQRPPVAADSIR